MNQDRIKVKLTDNTGGFWEDVVVYKTKPELLIKNLFNIPDNLANKIASDAIMSIRGKQMTKFNIRRKKRGQGVVVRSWKSGDYPYGIKKRKSPDGKSYKPLSVVTLKLRKWKKDKGKNILHTDERFILRETDQNIFYGMKYKIERYGKNNVRIHIYWKGKKGKIAYKQNKGFKAKLKKNEKRLRNIPARPFIGLQNKFLENLKIVYNKFFRSYGDKEWH